MHILYNNEHQHYGNDSIILDTISLVCEGWNTYIRYSHFARGSWFDPVHESASIEVDTNDIPQSQQKLDEFLKDKCLLEELRFNIADYI